MNKIWMPITAGVLDIISGVLGIGSGIPMGIMIGVVSWWGKVYTLHILIGQALLIIIGVLAIVGGVYALKRKRWRLALAGAIAALISCIPGTWFCWEEFYPFHIGGHLLWTIILWLFMSFAVVLPIVAITLTVLSKKQFERK